VICADSQETDSAGYKCAVVKLEPIAAGNFQVALGGTGDGEVIDGFVECLKDALGNSNGSTLAGFKRVFRDQWQEYDREVRKLPKDRRYMRFIACARATDGSDFDVWINAGSRLTAIRDDAPTLVGWDSTFYRHEARRLFAANLPALQVISLALRLFRLAETTSSYVSGPITVLILCKEGMWLERPEWVDVLRSRIDVFDSQFAGILRLCPDSSIATNEFDSVLQEFVETIRQLRDDFLQETGAHSFRNRFFYPVLPRDAVVQVGHKITVKEDPAQAEEHRRMTRQLLEQAMKRFPKAIEEARRNNPHLFKGKGKE